MKGNFDTCMDNHLKGYEGGYVNDPKDPGGETNFGISKRSYPKLNIKTLTWANAKVIYKHDFWDVVQGDQLPLGVDLVIVDPAINSGPKAAIKFLQTGLGLKADGVMGPKTLAALKLMEPIDIIERVSKARLGFMHGLRIWSRYGKGWSKRVADVEAAAVRMAGGAPGHMTQKAQGLMATAKDSAVTAGTGAAVATGGVIASPHLIDYWPVILSAVALALKSIGERAHQLNLADSYAKEAKNAGIS